jgi:hypothetical protein
MMMSVREIGLNWLHEFNGDSLGSGNKLADFHF